MATLGKDYVHRAFDWQEWCDYSEQGAKHPRFADKLGADDWDGGWNFSDTIDHARTDGYSDAIPDAKQLLTRIETDLGEGMVQGFVQVFDVAGSEVDMGRYMSGIPECMAESVPMKVMRTGRVIQVAIPVCYSSDIHAETIKQRGAAVMALVDAFAMMQHPVEIYAVDARHGHTRKSANRFSYTIKVQGADEPLNMGRIMYALAHPSMLRKMGFAANWNEDAEFVERFGIGFGYGTASYDARIEDLDINIENAIILPTLTSNYGWEEESAVKWIRKQLTMIEEGAT